MNSKILNILYYINNSNNNIYTIIFNPAFIATQYYSRAVLFSGDEIGASDRQLMNTNSTV